MEEKSVEDQTVVWDEVFLSTVPPVVLPHYVEHLLFKTAENWETFISYKNHDFHLQFVYQ